MSVFSYNDQYTSAHLKLFLRVRAWPSTGPWYIKYRFRLSKAAFYVCLQSPRFMREIVIFGMWFYKWSKSILWLICYHSETYKARPCPFIQKIILDAPTNSKFLDFSQLHPYFHLVKSFFTFFFVISITNKHIVLQFCVQLQYKFEVLQVQSLIANFIANLSANCKGF